MNTTRARLLAATRLLFLALAWSETARAEQDAELQSEEFEDEAEEGLDLDLRFVGVERESRSGQGCRRWVDGEDCVELGLECLETGSYAICGEL